MANKRICSVEGCDKPCLAKGYCVAHYSRLRKKGDVGSSPLRGRQAPFCSIEGCNLRADCRSLCSKHYTRYLRHGDPVKPVAEHRVSEGEALIAAAIQDHSEGCKFWPFTRNEHGYGRHLRQRVHRIICQAAHGPAPQGKPHALHRCGNGHLGCYSAACVYWGDQLDNMEDRNKHGTSNRGSRHGLSKLTEQDVRQIRGLKGIKTAKEIASEFGISKGYVTHIWMRLVWKWLDGNG